MVEAREENVETESLDPVGLDIQLVEPGDVEQAAQRCLLLDSTSSAATRPGSPETWDTQHGLPPLLGCFTPARRRRRSCWQ